MVATPLWSFPDASSSSRSGFFFFFSFSFFSSHTRVPIKSSPLMELKVCKLCAMWCELSPCLCLQVMVRALHAEWSNDSKSMSLDYGASFVEMENWLGWCLTCHSLNKIYVVAVRFRSSGANLIVKPFFFFFCMLQMLNLSYTSRKPKKKKKNAASQWWSKA